MDADYIDFAYVKEHANIRSVLEHYGVALPSNGAKNIKIRCLFHAEKHPSLSINLERKVFHCFGCDEGGDILQLVALKEGGDLREAARLIAELSRIPCAPERPTAERPARSRGAKAARASKQPRHEAPAAQTMKSRPARETRDPEAPETRETQRPEKAAEGPSRPLSGGAVRETADAHQNASPAPQDKAAAEPVNPPLRFALKLDPSHLYLTERGLSPEQIAAFGLGYAGKGLMKGRIAIPIHNETGQLVAYAGRWPGQEGWPSGEDKYKLPEGFKKSHALFNLHRTLDGAGQVPSEHLVLVEGYFAAMHLHALGIPVVALMGRTIAPQQVALLERAGVKWLSLMLDGDGPGRQSAVSLIPLLAQSFFVRDVVLPEGVEPDGLDAAALRSRCL